VNTRLQVEHGVTEEVTGVDLVEWMVKQAAGELDLAGFRAKPQGASMQVRLYAEDPGKDFQPAAGVLTEVVFPADARIETWVERGSDVPPSMTRWCRRSSSRGETAPKHWRKCSRYSRKPASPASRPISATSADRARRHLHGRASDTRYLNAFHYRPTTIDVIEPGVQSSIQDWPGRTGYWDVGVPRRPDGRAGPAPRQQAGGQ